MKPLPKSRLLIATGASAVDAAALPPLIRFLIEGASERFVVTPRLPGALHWLVSDIDHATHEADERLDSMLGHLDALGAPGTGMVDADTPMLALEDAVSAFKPDHILLALHSADEDGWQARHLVDRVRRRFHIPMTIFELDRSGSRPAQARAE
jgi:hypothetical protein